MFSTLTSAQFNFAEGVFWLLCAGAVWWACRTRRDTPLGRWGMFTTLVLALFGMSDFVQGAVGSFLLPGREWLLVWKVAGVVGLVLSAVWYLRLRLAE